MNVEPISLASLGELNLELDATSRSANGDLGFSDVILRGIASVNESIHSADKVTQSYVLGNEADVQDVMLALEEASLAMQLAVEIRNKTVEGIQELMRMSI